MERIRWHRERGDTVVVVSGALDVYLGHWCEAQGLAVICSRLEARGDLLSGRYHGAQCVGAEKARRVRERYDLGRFGEVYAYGDTVEDNDLLAIATKPCFRWRESA